MGRIDLYDESQHPRAPDGKWTDGSGGGQSGRAERSRVPSKGSMREAPPVARQQKAPDGKKEEPENDEHGWVNPQAYKGREEEYYAEVHRRSQELKDKKEGEELPKRQAFIKKHVDHLPDSYFSERGVTRADVEEYISKASPDNLGSRLSKREGEDNKAYYDRARETARVAQELARKQEIARDEEKHSAREKHLKSIFQSMQHQKSRKGMVGLAMFDESKHPRASDGRFGHTPGQHGSKGSEPKRDMREYASSKSRGITEQVEEGLQAGGFSLRPFADKPVPTSGIMVSLATKEGFNLQIPVTAPKSERMSRVRAWVEKALPYLAKHPDTYLGGWRDDEGGLYHLDVSERLDKSQLALAITRGYQRNQKSVFRLDDFREFKTGGTGLSAAGTAACFVKASDVAGMSADDVAKSLVQALSTE